MYAENINNTFDHHKEYQYYDRLHAEKYRDKDQTKKQHQNQIAKNLATNKNHCRELKDILTKERFLPAGRIQAALGATEREVSPFSCSVSKIIGDSIPEIYQALTHAAMILRLGTGIGYNFSHIRPKGDIIQSLQSFASGPLGYMDLFDASAALISSAGHRRGAQMGILNVSHPDIEKFIDAKMESGRFLKFNFSVGVSDAFMHCVENDYDWHLIFNNKVYKTVNAKKLWNKIVHNAYTSAEPGVVFLDRMNRINNLWYCEQIEATNPCSEQPLPPYGLCTLGSFNLTQYLIAPDDMGYIKFDYDMFKNDIHAIVEAYDNIFDDAIYAIPEHKEEALNKRRIGLGLTGIANAIEMMVGRPCYGEKEFNTHLEKIAETLTIEAYKVSIELSKKRGPFSSFDAKYYTLSKFIEDTLPNDLVSDISKYGIRNSHLISYAPCGTISQCAGNVSSGVEPVFYHELDRNVLMPQGKEQVTLTDWAFRVHGFKGKTLEECTVEQHLAVAQICQKWCDSSVSKTINVAPNCTYDEYKDVYDKSYKMGLKGVTVFRPSELRGAVITKSERKGDDKKSVESNQVVNTSEFGTFTCASGVCER